MNRGIRLRLLICVGLFTAALGACRSAPTRLHTLNSLPSLRGPMRYSGPPVRVDAVHVPPEIDRAAIITRMGTDESKIHELDHWAAALSKLARQALTADLITRLPSGKVIIAPLEKPAGALGLKVVILQSSPGPGGAQFVASWQTSAEKSSVSDTHIVRLRLNPADTPDEVVARFSELLAELADRIAAQLSDGAAPPSP